MTTTQNRRITNYKSVTLSLLALLVGISGMRCYDDMPSDMYDDPAVAEEFEALKEMTTLQESNIEMSLTVSSMISLGAELQIAKFEPALREFLGPIKQIEADETPKATTEVQNAYYIDIQPENGIFGISALGLPARNVVTSFSVDDVVGMVSNLLPQMGILLEEADISAETLMVATQWSDDKGGQSYKIEEQGRYVFVQRHFEGIPVDNSLTFLFDMDGKLRQAQGTWTPLSSRPFSIAGIFDPESFVDSAVTALIDNGFDSKAARAVNIRPYFRVERHNDGSYELLLAGDAEISNWDPTKPNSHFGF